MTANYNGGRHSKIPQLVEVFPAFSDENSIACVYEVECQLGGIQQIKKAEGSRCERLLWVSSLNMRINRQMR